METSYPARYADGRTAALYDVRLRLSGSGLDIHDVATGLVLASWPIARIRKINEDLSELLRLRLDTDENEAARLTLLDREILPELEKAGATLVIRHSWSKRLGIAAGTVVLILLLLSSGIWGWPLLADGIAGLLPDSFERQLGANAKKTIITVLSKIYPTQPALCTSAPGLAALNKLVTRIAAGFPEPVHFSADIAQVKMVNAFALPGGEIVVTSELIKFADSPEEVAAVLSHEMAHAVRHHPTRGMVRAAGYNILIGLVFGNNFGSSLGETILNSAYTRDMEAEADRLGLTALRDVGIKKTGLTDFFRRLRDKEGDRAKFLSLLSTHPSFEDRITAADAISDKPNAGPAMTSKEWEALRKACDQTKPVP